MSCLCNQNQNSFIVSGYTCNIDALLAKYPHIDFRDVFKVIFDGLRNLEEDCGYYKNNSWKTTK